jgi:IclR family KDG regulon transcriptional repressor
MSSLEKALKILKVLGEKPYEWGVTAVANRVGVGKSGAYKLLSDLEAAGMVMQKKNKNYCLGPVTFLLGTIYERHVGIYRFCRPYLERMRDLSDENASLGMWIDGKVRMVAREESHQLIRVAGTVGSTRPFYASAIGKTLGAFSDEDFIREKILETKFEKFTEHTITSPNQLLAEFEKIRKQGYSISDEEYSNGAMGVGAPIMSPSGHAWAAISIGAPKIRVTPEKLDQMIYLVTETARQISEDLNGRELKE